MDPKALMKSPEGRRTLIDMLPAEETEIFTVSVAKGVAREGAPAGPGTPAVHELAFNRDKTWSITILDEGPPEPTVVHRKTAFRLARNDFYRRASTAPIAASQLTAAKLERLMARYAGKEWLPSRLTHLDDPESERADVLRGLRTYVSASPDNARTFAELYARLPKASQVLEPETVKSLTSADALQKDKAPAESAKASQD
jgi:hypothetical protein